MAGRSNKRHRGSRRRRGASRSRAAFIGNLLVTWIVVALVTWSMTPQLLAFWTQVSTSREERAAIEASVYYRNCDAARAAGKAPVYQGTPGYREGLDGDSDGVACEPWH